MISKERLEELIEQGATIWIFNKVDGVYSVNLSLLGGYMLGETCVITENNGVLITTHLYETKEEAEWDKEFGCIERTERLELPTWEEIKHDFIYNKQSAGNYCVVEFSGFQEYSLDIVVYNGDAMITISDEDFYEPLTKENYTLACRKAKELFLGETKC